MSYREHFSEWDYPKYLDIIRVIADGLYTCADQTDESDPATAEDVLAWYLADGERPEGWDDEDTAILRRELERIYEEVG
jgi:hypothetical protein